MELVNTNRLRVSVYRDVFSRGRPRCGAYKSLDHGGTRLERNVFVSAYGLTALMKWRPDGKYRPSAGPKL